VAVRRLAAFGLTSVDATRLARFYEEAFACREVGRHRCSGLHFEELMAVAGGAICVTLILGNTSIEILEFDEPGQPYASDLSPFDNAFQHFAIVVDDMAAAYAHLCRIPGWTPISMAGPQQLPASSGSVIAFKFRDPDGHPLELLNFKKTTPQYWRRRSGAATFLGIDHSAVSISDKAASIAYYENIGLKIAARSFNHGIEQRRLDGIENAMLDVIGLAPCEATPHVELLCYRHRIPARSGSIRSNDVCATRLIFEADDATAREHAAQVFADVAMQDPDGHHLLVRNRNSRVAS